MRVAVVAVLLLGVCLALAADVPKEPLSAEAAKYHGESKWASSDKWEWDDKTHAKHGKDGKDGVDGKDGKDGKDGRDGRPGPQGPAGKDGKDGRDGRPGRDGRDAWVVVAWRNGPNNKVNVTSDGCRRAINQITSKVTCAEGEKAIACSCDTGMSSSAGNGFVAPSGRDASIFTRANYITLVENALSGPKDKDKDTCTCTGLYVATIRGSRRGGDDDEDGEDGDDDDGHHHGHGPKQHDEHYVDAKNDAKSNPKSADPKAVDKTTDAKIAYKGDGEYYDDCKSSPKWQAFEITAMATCESVKLVPRPHHKDEYDYAPEYEHKHTDKKKKSKKYEDDDDDDDKEDSEYKKEEEKPKKVKKHYPDDDDEEEYKY